MCVLFGEAQSRLEKDRFVMKAHKFYTIRHRYDYIRYIGEYRGGEYFLTKIQSYTEYLNARSLRRTRLIKVRGGT